MTKNDAIRAANAFVKRKYPLLPEVVMVTHFAGGGRLHARTWFRHPGSSRWLEGSHVFDPNDIGRLLDEYGFRSPAAEAETAGLYDSWRVSYFMSWHTDEAGMPQTLLLSIDDATGAVTQTSPG